MEGPGLLIPELAVEFKEDTQFKHIQLRAVIKSSINNALGTSKYTVAGHFEHTNRVLEHVMAGVVALGKPFKYVVTCTLAPKSYGIGTYQGHKCYWNPTNDNFIIIPWENKTMRTIVTVFGLGIFAELGWPKDVPLKLCKYTPQRYQTKHEREKVARQLAWEEEHRLYVERIQSTVYMSEAAKALALKRSRLYRDDDLGANKYNCVDTDDVVIFEDVEKAVHDFRAIRYNRNYYLILEAEKAAIRAAEQAIQDAEDEAAEELADAEAEALEDAEDAWDAIHKPKKVDPHEGDMTWF